MSFYLMSIIGMSTLSSILSGALATKIGAPQTIFISGLFCIIGAFIFALKIPALRQEVHPVYVKIGILPAATK